MTTNLLAILVFCLAQMETPNGVPYNPGAHQERGRWQLTPAVRADRTRDLIAQHYRGMISDQTIAAAQVEWIRGRLIANGCQDPTPYMIGVAWNAGVHAAVSGHLTARSYDYGRRFATLVKEEQRK